MFQRIGYLRGAAPVALVSAGAALLLAGCTAATSGGTAGSESSAQAGASTVSTGQAAAGPTAAAQGCQTADLSISLGAALPSGAQGSLVRPVVLQNTGSAACTVLGWPGLAALNGSGDQIYQASRVGSEGSQTTLQPGSTAAAVLYAVTSIASGGSSCTQVPNLLVTPPNETHSTQVPLGVALCVAPALTALTPGSNGAGTDQSAGEFAEAQELWRAGAQAISAAQGGYWIEASGLLNAAAGSGAPGSSGFATAAQHLTQLASLPDAMQSAAQQAQSQTDTSALNSFFSTPGLYS